MVMESCKAAPALRARFLRSYVPLRRDPSESVLSGTIPGLHGGSFLHPQIQIRLSVRVYTSVLRPVSVGICSLARLVSSGSISVILKSSSAPV